MKLPLPLPLPHEILATWLNHFYDAEIRRRYFRGLEFAENLYQLRKFRVPSNQQFELIADQKFVSV